MSTAAAGSGGGRVAAVLLPLFSLRSDQNWGVGEIGDIAPFASWAHGCGLGAVQLLPVHEVGPGESSPYAAVTAFALDPVYLTLSDCPDFVATGGEAALDEELRRRLDGARQSPVVAWSEVRAVKAAAFARAFEHFKAHEWQTDSARAHALRAHREAKRYWLEDYTLHWALTERHGPNWRAWPEPLRTRNPEALAQARAELADRVFLREWLEWQLDEQWRAARERAAASGVQLWGDLPFVMSSDGADVWAHQDLFRLDRRAGAPPDAFTADGQDWGLPVYDWPALAGSGYQWMKARAAREGELYDLYRVDHVVGLYRTYTISNEPGADGRPVRGFLPEHEPDQLRNGDAVLRILSHDAQIIAEDLGVVPDFVRASLTALGVPGYRVLRWEKDGPVFRDPARWPELSVSTSGTHDTDSMAEWFDGLPAEERDALMKVPGTEPIREAHRFDDRVRDALLQLLYQAPSRITILPLSDLLGTRERINTPGTVGSANWSFRMPESLAQLAQRVADRDRLRALAVATGRAR